MACPAPPCSSRRNSGIRHLKRCRSRTKHLVVAEKIFRNKAGCGTRENDEAGALGEKLGPVLVQLPPSLAFKADLAGFFYNLRVRFEGHIGCEP